jgi:hypothetical protein
MTSRYDAPLTFSAMNCERDGIRKKLIIMATGCAFCFSVSLFHPGSDELAVSEVLSRSGPAGVPVPDTCGMTSGYGPVPDEAIFGGGRVRA